ncbi:UxaA family hydrolase [Coraliomargarita akajimensis]|uniref:Altronate dehydratase n=1 Tax=Coraliomargarita akajimensis (strain DSM 45221 / IAM 15411 / JCM 23193 / KCTC 12865 / 04OKA010-24) TaxID=583355 RepID=D5EPK5_CORAD|nr:UxaA family hydrolase [Coraliomargarita akajimensis]ADE53742.1 Altronate dehydratase [Coraliomargarita akajimensis DSM 45221]
MATPLQELARFPVQGDNAAIALKDLKRGTRIQNGDTEIELQHDILTGHRFAAIDIKSGERITSWNYPFGTAERDIQAGEYLCNRNVLFRLSIQEDPHFTELELPKEPNFNDEIDPYGFDANKWVEPAAIEMNLDGRSFMGYDRGSRGSGTRNHLVILNTSSTTAPLVERLEAIYKKQVERIENVDAVIGLRHTETVSPDEEEHERTLRTLSGLLSNSNVGGFVAIDSGLDDDLTNDELIGWMKSNGLPVDEMRFELLSASDSFGEDVKRCSEKIEGMLDILSTDQRTERPVSHLRIGLQCGASDAFSGICGNVLSGAIGREVIRLGGIANLTETPELSGAEDYTLSSIASPQIAPRFLAMLERFKTYLGWHGGKVDKNPSEGNLLGGLYNITLKSLGAAVKRDPKIPIQHIIEYGQGMSEPGFYFMDGMGGDIASYTGQAAAGCNIVLFVTGRGSPTNSSIVPTIKIVNTTVRYKMMEGDIDINAGEYLDGKPMEQLTEEALDHVVTIASGERTKGERRNQNIDLLWRRKFFRNKPTEAADSIPTRFSGNPLLAQAPKGGALNFNFQGRSKAGEILPKPKVALIIPTVGCSLATAQQAADRLNQSEWVKSGRVTRFAVLANTEGCGVTTGAEVLNFILSYATHRQVEACLFLSLGCEMVSPGFIKSAMRGEDIGFPEITAAAKKSNLDPDKFGWLTIQDAGGTEHTLTAASEWFDQALSKAPSCEAAEGNAANLRVGLLTSGFVSDVAQDSIAEYARQIISAGGSVVIPQASTLLHSDKLFAQFPIEPSLVFAQAIDEPGLHVMESVTDNRLEQVTGLGAAVDVIINFSETRPITAHTLTPTLNVTASQVRGDFDLQLKAGDEAEWSQQIADISSAVLSGVYEPRQNTQGHTGNQIPRGARAHAI